MLKGFAAIFLIVILSSCSVPETRIYNLNLPAEKSTETNAAADKSLVIILQAPRLLAQPYIAYRTSPYQLEVSKYSKWDSAPGDIVKEAIKDSLATAGLFKEVTTGNTSPSGFYSLRVSLKRFERVEAENSPFGELVFDAKLSSPDSRQIFSVIISKKVKLDDKTFLSLAKGLSVALAEGIEEMKKDISSSLGK